LGAEHWTQTNVPKTLRFQPKLSLAEFIRQAWHIVEPNTPLVWNWHIDGLCLHLEAVTRGEIKKLLINIPPGTMKSLIVSVFWPAWEWTQKPGLQYLAGSYGDAVSIRDNIKMRDLVSSTWYQERWLIEFKQEQNQKVRFDNTEGGWRIATSVEGRGTGEHPDRIIVDDPHKASESQTEVDRLKVKTWLDQTLATRGISKDVAIVIVMQRLHEEDASGHILSRGDKDEWVHICLPMRYEVGRMKETPIGWSDPRTKPGELLWPALFPEAVVHTLEMVLGSYGTAGQLQQRPSPEGGDIFKEENWRYVNALPAGIKFWVRSWDKAGTQNAGKWTVGVLIGKEFVSPTLARYYVADVKRARLSAGPRNRLILETSHQDRATYRSGPYRIRIEQEPGSGGKESAEISVGELAGFDVVAKPASGEGDKVARARPLAAQQEVGNVYLLRADWNKAFVEEFNRFGPGAAVTDQVDAAAHGFNELALGQGGGGQVQVTGW
jgi:predicted phage terminase large subunit-like protein